MILVGSQRGGAKDLALHLMKQENEHVAVHEVRGFASGTVMGALNEAYAVSRGTNARKFLYSLSINPPPDKQIATSDFVSAIDRTERELGLSGQPRVIVFHEKQGRRHAHCVWSRIDSENMRAIHIPYDRKRLIGLTRDLFIEHGWRLPDGLINKQNRDPTNYTLAEYQQAKRIGRKPQGIKTDFQSAWAQSDSLSSYRHALRERGYWLAKGDRRGFVALDHNLKPFSVSRWTGLKAKEIRERLGEVDDRLPTIEAAKLQIEQEMGDNLLRLQTHVQQRSYEAQTRFEARRVAVVRKQKAERAALIQSQERKRIAANQERQARFARGLSGIWDRLRGEHKRIRQHNEREAFEQARADQQRRDEMIWRHLQERQRIEVFKLRHRTRANAIERDLMHDRQRYASAPMPEP